MNDLEVAARDEATIALEEIRPEVVSHCWPGGSPPGGPQIGLTYELTFDRDGREIARAVRDNGEQVPDDVRNCLHGYPVPPFRTGPSSQTLNVDVFASYP